MERNLPPIPPQIAALPQDRGFPVPWVAEWNSRTETVAVDEQFGRMLACDCAPGQGRATLGVNCAVRQREAMRDRLCGTCGTAIIGPMAMVGTRDMPYSVEPGLHLDCAVFSLLACPRLAHAGGRAGLVVMDRYTLMEDRILGVNPDRTLIRHMLPPLLGAISGGVLAYLVAIIPSTAQRFRATDWLDANRHILTSPSPTSVEGHR
ncbi:hypothetical protein ACIA8R_29580 [Nonomuraea sp. NPDC051191]|uniref:hypothetical protein n=1 Tax=Nonomuraea sp. NPDC051191 TaxID=3364372 RepID=UPI0037A98000